MEVRRSEEAAAWMAELEKAEQAAREEVAAKVAANKAANAAKAQAKLQERLDWIAQHGSVRLKRCVAENIACDGIYRDERLAVDRPAWFQSQRVRGDFEAIINASLPALELLDAARKTLPTGAPTRLVYWSVGASQTEHRQRVPRYIWRGPAVISEHLGVEIVYGVPDKFYEGKSDADDDGAQ